MRGYRLNEKRHNPVIVFITFIYITLFFLSIGNRTFSKERKPVIYTVTETIESVESVTELVIEPTIITDSVIQETIVSIETEPPEKIEILYESSAKTYMDYRSITNHDSAQYKLIHSNKIEICEDGFLRDKDGFIGVALGSYFGPIGSKYICYTEDGKKIPVIKVEAKSDHHAINGFCGSANYDIIEFVIDTNAQWMKNNTWSNGYIFSGNFNNYDLFEGIITNIEKIE